MESLTIFCIDVIKDTDIEKLFQDCRHFLEILQHFVFCNLSKLHFIVEMPSPNMSKEILD